MKFQLLNTDSLVHKVALFERIKDIWEKNTYNQSVIFHLSFQKNPFGKAYYKQHNLALLAHTIQSFSFKHTLIYTLMREEEEDGQALFQESFLNYLQRFHFSCDIDAPYNNTILFPHQPLIRGTGTLLESFLLEFFLFQWMKEINQTNIENSGLIYRITDEKRITQLNTISIKHPVFIQVCRYSTKQLIYKDLIFNESMTSTEKHDGKLLVQPLLRNGTLITSFDPIPDEQYSKKTTSYPITVKQMD